MSTYRKSLRFFAPFPGSARLGSSDTGSNLKEPISCSFNSTSFSLPACTCCVFPHFLCMQSHASCMYMQVSYYFLCGVISVHPHFGINQLSFNEIQIHLPCSYNHTSTDTIILLTIHDSHSCRNNALE